MIGVDWGTTSFRAFRLGQDGLVLERRSAAAGILQVDAAGFAGVLREQVGPWLAAGKSQVLLSGMVGSRQGWVEAPYLPCPAGPAELATALTRIPFEGAEVRLVPGVSAEDASGVPEVMRGEETQIAGRAGGDRGSGAGLSAGEPFEMGADRGRADCRLRHAPHRRSLRGAVRPYDPRPDDAAGCARRRGLRPRRGTLGGTGRAAASSLRGAHARADGAAAGARHRLLPLGAADRTRNPLGARRAAAWCI